MGAYPLQHPRHREAAERPRGNDGDGFRRGVIDDGQTLQDAPICRAVEDEISRPDLVAVLRADQRLAIDDRHFLAPTALDLQSGLGGQPVDPSVIDRAPLLPQLEVDQAGCLKYARYYRLLLVEGHLTWRLFGDMLLRIWVLPVPEG